jgi:hypothetical protein
VLKNKMSQALENNLVFNLSVLCALSVPRVKINCVLRVKKQNAAGIKK